MSFFKKLTSEIKELIGDKDDKSKQEVNQGTEIKRDQNSLVQPQPQPSLVGSNQYVVPPDQIQLPPGWLRQWDQNSQKWYYIEQASGRSQWEPPQMGYGGVPGHVPEPYLQVNNDKAWNGPASENHGHTEKRKTSGKGGMIAAGAGGLAVGALAGAALSGDSSDDEQMHTRAPVSSGYHVGTAAPVVPLENNPELSSSQRSSLEEARKEYQEAQREVNEDSDPSSSDIEELAEAREEYLSEVESAHEELED